MKRWPDLMLVKMSVEDRLIRRHIKHDEKKSENKLLSSFFPKTNKTKAMNTKLLLTPFPSQQTQKWNCAKTSEIVHYVAVQTKKNFLSFARKATSLGY